MHTYMRKTCLRSSKIRQWAVRILSLISMFILICHMTLVVDQNFIRSSNMNNLVLDFCQQSPLKKIKKEKKRKRKKEKKQQKKTIPITIWHQTYVGEITIFHQTRVNNKYHICQLSKVPLCSHASYHSSEKGAPVINYIP